MNFLDQIPIVSTVRRNHGVEHATIHVLASRLQNLALVGHATLDGFNLYGEVEADQVDSAANEALRRLRAGDSRLHDRVGRGILHEEAVGLAGGDDARHVADTDADERRAVRGALDIVNARGARRDGVRWRRRQREGGWLKDLRRFARTPPRAT